MIIALSGWARTGKDTVAKRLVEEHGFERFAFADKVKEMAIELNPMLSTGRGAFDEIEEYDLHSYFPCDEEIGTIDGWEHAKRFDEVRILLQTLGNKMRLVLGEQIWIDAIAQQILSSANAVVTDVRYWNEYAWLASQGARMVRVDREGTAAANDHVSEHEWTRLQYPTRIHNDGTVEDLHKTVDETLTHFRGLARFAKFDDV